MKSLRFPIAALALSTFLAGCTQDAGVNAGDVEYREIRVDLFSQRWAGMREEADDVKQGGRVLIHDDVEYELTTLSTLKPLPDHVFRTVNGERRLLYTFDPEPQSYTCLIKRKGWLYESYEEPGDSVEVTFTRTGEDWTGSTGTSYYFFSPDEVWITRENCGVYYPGRGLDLRVGVDVGEVIVRY